LCAHGGATNLTRKLKSRSTDTTHITARQYGVQRTVGGRGMKACCTIQAYWGGHTDRPVTRCPAHRCAHPSQPHALHALKCHTRVGRERGRRESEKVGLVACSGALLSRNAPSSSNVGTHSSRPSRARAQAQGAYVKAYLKVSSNSEFEAQSTMVHLLHHPPWQQINTGDAHALNSRRTRTRC
jgi:hypothetical protein